MKRLLLLVGSILLVLCGWELKQTLDLDRNGIRSPARVAWRGMEHSSSTSRRGTPTVHLEYTDEEGNVRILRHPDLPGVPPPTYVVFRPGHPDDPYVDGSGLLFLPSFLLLFGALGAFALAALRTSRQ
jgi:hypothetical protein